MGDGKASAVSCTLEGRPGKTSQQQMLGRVIDNQELVVPIYTSLDARNSGLIQEAKGEGRLRKP